jgi:hypothetical protein
MAENMHTILDTFLKDHEGIREMDETTRREVKIIEFLKAKSSQVEASINETSTFEEPLEFMTSTDVQPLLSIQKPPRNTIFTPLHASGSPMAASVEPTSQLGQVLPSLTIQRLQGESGNETSNSGSPAAEDESAAQNLLDHWYTALSTSSGAGGDGSLDYAGLPWGGFGSTDLSGWFGTTPSAEGSPYITNPSLAPVSDGSDCNYWENIVKVIRGEPVA